MTYLRSFLNLETFSQMVKVGIVGVANFVASFAIFNAMRLAGLSTFWAITVAFGTTTIMSYLLNRRWSFRLRDGGENVSETGKFVVVNIAAWGGTEALMWLAKHWFGPLDLFGENIALLIVSAIILGPKFATYRDVVFRDALRGASRQAIGDR